MSSIFGITSQTPDYVESTRGSELLRQALLTTAVVGAILLCGMVVATAEPLFFIGVVVCVIAAGGLHSPTAYLWSPTWISSSYRPRTVEPVFVRSVAPRSSVFVAAPEPVYRRNPPPIIPGVTNAAVGTRR